MRLRSPSATDGARSRLHRRCPVAHARYELALPRAAVAGHDDPAGGERAMAKHQVFHARETEPLRVIWPMTGWAIWAMAATFTALRRREISAAIGLHARARLPISRRQSRLRVLTSAHPPKRCPQLVQATEYFRPPKFDTVYFRKPGWRQCLSPLHPTL